MDAAVATKDARRVDAVLTVAKLDTPASRSDQASHVGAQKGSPARLKTACRLHDSQWIAGTAMSVEI